ncbi:hypothetical protein CDAR_385561 [Caerostris darwini]|uniref:Uncharacterized protein n=1 Tax=Caerostris darwini TaxID=1538125 RepID=A0AAV4M3S4_9ARAC|nr:hypothetical protein CDAR_385561 [Caerostris darwini]
MRPVSSQEGPSQVKDRGHRTWQGTVPEDFRSWNAKRPHIFPRQKKGLPRQKAPSHWSCDLFGATGNNVALQKFAGDFLFLSLPLISSLPEECSANCNRDWVGSRSRVHVPAGSDLVSDRVTCPKEG